MSERKTVSVAMAAYNGMRFLDGQIGSILPQLKDGDELVVSCDPSTDGTWEHLAALSEKDGRIRPFPGPGQGVQKNFENALTHCIGDVIFLSDQDDVWLPGKVAAVLDVLEKTGAGVVLHDAQVTDGELTVLEPSFFRMRGCKPGYLRNLLKNSYIGCCMAFRREVLLPALPFPDGIPMHDQWLGLIGSRFFKTVFLEQPLILYRRHGGNVSSDRHAGFSQMLRWRFRLWRALTERTREYRKNGANFTRDLPR